MGGALTLVGVGALLAVSNPSAEDYKDYAAEKLVELAIEKVCDDQSLPLVFSLWIENCPALITDQTTMIGDLAGKLSTRRNLVFLSIYTTNFRGDDLFPVLRLPSYSVRTLAIAGNFLTVNYQKEEASHSE